MKFLVSHVIQTELRDPRLGFVTVLEVEPTLDLREAKVRLSVLGGASERSKTLHALEDARGFIQKRVGKSLDTRYVPQLHLELVEPEDDAVKNIERILEQGRPTDDEQDEQDEQDGQDGQDGDGRTAPESEENDDESS